MQNVTPTKLRRRFNIVKHDLESQGRSKISDYHVLHRLKEILPEHLKPASFGYVHGLSRHARSMNAEDRKVALRSWVWSVACYVHGGFICEHCGGNNFQLKMGAFPISKFPKFCSRPCAFGNLDFQNKRNSTCLRKYGKSFSAVVSTNLKEGRETCQDQRTRSWKESIKSRYGSLENFASYVVDKRVATWKRKYGVSNPSQSPEIFAKQNAYRVKNVTINDKTFQTQGYEGQVIRSLVSKGLKVSQIESWRKELPTFPFNQCGKLKVYHPDLLVNKRTVVEVKSTYTLGLHSSNRPKFAILKLKAAAVESAGYRFILALAANRKVYYFNSDELSIQHIRRRLNEHRTKDRSAVES